MSAPATRSNLAALGRRLELVRRGAALLRRKREVLVGELFRIARPALDARERIGAEAEVAWTRLHEALAARGADELGALALPGRSVPIEVSTRSVWGVEVPALGPPPPLARTLAVRDQDPGAPGPAAETAAGAFERLAELLLEAAPRELVLERLGEQLVRTTRQVNRLEQRVDPEIAAVRDQVRRTLEEREREDHVRLAFLLRRR